jgi:spoIIIJ-associated protein
MASIEISAPDVENAIAQGLSQLNLMRAEVKIEIIEEGSKGVLGIGTKPARVRLTPYSELEATDKASEPVVIAEPLPVNKVSPAPVVSKEPIDESAMDESSSESFDESANAPSIEGEAFAVELTQNILERMGFRRATCNGTSVMPADADDQPSIAVKVKVDPRDEETFFAFHGELIHALQTVVQTMWSHKTKSSLRINLDVNDFKARRQEKIVNMATRMAERVVANGKAITLEPMSAAERRVVHMALRDHPQVFTESFGEGMNRKVQIKLKQ